MKPSSSLTTFEHRKQQILASIQGDGQDLSPKGSVDTPILPLVNLLNSHDGIVTTSSCSGRISIFLEGMKKEPGLGRLKVVEASKLLHDIDHDNPDEVQESQGASFGGKGSGGRWLFVSHEALDSTESSRIVEDIYVNHLQRPSQSEYSTTNITSSTRFVHFKFEPMILHILTADLETAQKLLSLALASSFRESGIMNSSGFPIVAIRTTGLAFDTPIGIMDADNKALLSLVDKNMLQMLISLSSLRFTENKRRMKVFEEGFMLAMSEADNAKKDDWEPREARAERKRREGLQKSLEKEKTVKPASVSDLTDAALGSLFG